MTTDRTNAARPAAPTDRPAAPSERRDSGNAFAALLDAHATPPREPRGRRDDAQARREEPRRDEVRHGDIRRDEARRDEVRHGEVRRDERPGHDRLAARDEAHPPAAAPGQAAVTADAPARPASDVAQTPLPVTPAQPTADQVIAGLLTAPVAETATPVPATPVPAAAAPVVSLPFEVAPEAFFAPAPVLPGPVAPPVAAPAGTQPAIPAAPQFTTTLQAAPAVAPDAAAPVEAAPAAAPQALPAEPVPSESPTPAAAPSEPAAPETAAPAPAQAPARAGTAEPAAPAPAAAPATEPATLGPAPLSIPLSGHVAPERAAPLHRAPAAVATLLHVAAERGITRAKMALKPAELGGIEIRLQASAAGIAAQVVADSPEAARLLAQAGDDLRRALEARDVTLISLEVSTTGDDRRQSARGEWSDGDEAATGHAGADSVAPDTEPNPTSHTVIELPGGLLVDVLA